MKRSIYRSFAVVLLASAGLVTTGVGIGNATTLQTEGSYGSRQDCLNAGPGVKAATPPFNWNDFWCIPDPQTVGNWRLVLSN